MQNVKLLDGPSSSRLGKMFQDLCNLSARFHALEINNKKTEKELSNLIREVYVSWISYDKYLVAIAGLQGVGKTTFLRNYLGLDTTWLEDNPGRGECFPVLVIQEPGRKEAKGIIRKLVLKDGLYELQEQSVTPDEFSRTIRSGFGDGSDSTLTLLPVLKIPVATPFHQIGFLLLPGYETKKADWQELMCHSLVSANLPVIVTDSQALATDGIKKIRDDLKKYLENVEPVVIYSKIDDIGKKPEQAFERVQKAFGIQTESHLVFTGTGNPEYIRFWRDNVNRAIEDSYVEQSLWRQKKLSALKELISDKMMVLLSDLNVEISQGIALNEVDSLFVKMTNEYTNAVGKLRKDFETILTTAVSQKVQEAKDIAVKRYNAEEAGNILETAGQKIRDWFCDDNRKARNLNKILKESWEATDNDFSNNYLNSVTNLTFTKLEICNAKKEDANQDSQNLPGLVSYPEGKKKTSTGFTCAVKDEILTNINLLFNDYKKEASLKEDAYFRTTIKLLPVLALELSRLCTLKSYVSHTVPAQNSSETSIPDSFTKNTESGKKILHAIGSMLFIDASADGKVDTIPALWGLISGAEKATMNPYVLAATAVFLVGTLGVTMGDELNKEHGRCRASLVAGLDTCGSKFKGQIMENFNTMMEDLWDAVDSRFSLRFNRNSRLGHIQSARFYITTLKSEAANFLTSIDLSLVTSSQA